MASGELQTSRGAAHVHATSGFLQTGGVPLDLQGSLPSSGWFTRLLLRNTPIPVLIHSLLDELSAQRSLQFVEDRYMPEPFLRYLNGRGLGLGPPASFFLHDRQPLRGGLVLAGRAAGESPADTRDFAHDLRRRLTHWLRMADRGPDAARLVTVEEARDFFSRRFAHYDPVGVLVWSAERSPVEGWIAARANSDRPLQIAATQAGTDPADAAAQKELIPAFAEAHPVVQDAPAVRPAAGAVARRAAPLPDSAGDDATEQAASRLRTVQSGSREAPGVSDTGRAGEPKRPTSESARAGLPVSQAPVATGKRGANDSADPTEAVHSSGVLEYQVVGRTRGPVSGGRKYHIRRDGEHLRIALLASESQRLAPDHALAFFDRLQFAGDLIRAHRDLLRAMSPQTGTGAGVRRVPTRNQSLSLELNCETGAFRCVAHGITPLFFRRKNGRLYPLPDSAALPDDPEQQGSGALKTLKTVEGVFHHGDALLLMPGVYTANERRELAGRYRDLLNDGESGPQRLAASLGPWLDARLRGRGLLIGRP
ncbi:MAG: hypothetical protein NXI24_13555 [bacterium]|nr:hypothetical protein [bacterium]